MQADRERTGLVRDIQNALAMKQPDLFPPPPQRRPRPPAPERVEEVKRVRVTVDGVARLMNGRFVLDRSKLEAFGIPAELVEEFTAEGCEPRDPAAVPEWLRIEGLDE